MIPRKPRVWPTFSTSCWNATETGRTCGLPLSRYWSSEYILISLRFHLFLPLIQQKYPRLRCLFNILPRTNYLWVPTRYRSVLDASVYTSCWRNPGAALFPKNPEPIGSGCNSKRLREGKPPESLSTADVKEFLTWLAVKKEVAASTQNQVFNSLLFFYRHVLQKEFGKVEGVVRAKRRPYIPVVLSREEIEAVLSHLARQLIW